MLRLRLTPDERTAVQALRRDRTLTPAERDRVEMVLLSADGWSSPLYWPAPLRTVIAMAIAASRS